jgi:hypothetical protein
MKPKPKWIPLDDAIHQIMASKKCTREEATDFLAFAVQGNKVKARKVASQLPPEPRPTGEEAAKLFRDKSEAAYMPLGYIIKMFGFSPEDVQGELASGRLVASWSNNVNFSVKLGHTVPADQFEITMKALQDWLCNPETPPHMLEQLIKTLDASGSSKGAASDIVIKSGHPTGEN